MFNYPYGGSQQINLNWIINEIIQLHKQLDPDYETPTFTQIYPFSETQQLNLDWILTELKALKELAPTPAPTEAIDEVGQALIAGAYAADTSYQKNDYIVQDSKLYRANAATTGTFDPTKWNEVMLGDDLAIITRWADATNTYLNRLAASNVANDSSVTGTTVKDALNTLKNDVSGMTTDDVSNESDVTGTTATDALNKLNGALNDVVIVGNNTPFTSANIPSNAVLKGTFVLSSLYEMSANQVLRGDGCVVTVSGNDSQIKLNNNVIIDGINFKGSWNPSRTTSGAHLVPILTETALTNHAQTVYAENTDIYHSLLYTDTSIAERIKIVNCNFENINKCCIWIMGGDHSTMKRTIIANNHFQTVWCGVAIFSEFCSLSSNIYDRCITGNSISSGNAAVTGQIFKQCDCSIYYGANGGNSAHNEVCGCELAHSNLYGLYIKNITDATGNLFSGCQIVDSPIKAETANDVAFVGCRIDTYVVISAGANNLITNCLVGDAYLDGHSLFSVVGTFIYDNKPLRSTSETSINPYPPSYTSALTLQTVNAARGVGNVTYSLDTRVATIQGRADNYYDGSFHAIPIGTGSNPNPIFIIPSVCRPKTNITVPATFIMLDGTSQTYELSVLTTGEIYNGYSSSVRSAMFSASYVFN